MKKIPSKLMLIFFLFNFSFQGKADLSEEKSYVKLNQNAKKKYRIIQPQMYHGDEVFSEDEVEANWFALVNKFIDNQSFFIAKKCNLKISLVRDDIVDGKDGSPSGKTISCENITKTNNNEKIQFVISGIDFKEEQMIPLVNFKKPWDKLIKKKSDGSYSALNSNNNANKDPYYEVLLPLKSIDSKLSYNTKNHLLLVQKLPEELSKGSVNIGQLSDHLSYVHQNFTLIPHKTNQSIKFTKSGPSSILAIADLNTDGIPDFILDRSDHYNVSDISLFLSEVIKSNEVTASDKNIDSNELGSENKIRNKSLLNKTPKINIIKAANRRSVGC